MINKKIIFLYAYIFLVISNTTKAMDEVCLIETLPPEILYKIAYQLDIYSLTNFSYVNTYIHNSLESDIDNIYCSNKDMRSIIYLLNKKSRGYDIFNPKYSPDEKDTLEKRCPFFVDKLEMLYMQFYCTEERHNWFVRIKDQYDLFSIQSPYANNTLEKSYRKNFFSHHKPLNKIVPSSDTIYSFCNSFISFSGYDNTVFPIIEVMEYFLVDQNFLFDTPTLGIFLQRFLYGKNFEHIKLLSKYPNFNCNYNIEKIVDILTYYRMNDYLNSNSPHAYNKQEIITATKILLKYNANPNLFFNHFFPYITKKNDLDLFTLLLEHNLNPNTLIKVPQKNQQGRYEIQTIYYTILSHKQELFFTNKNFYSQIKQQVVKQLKKDPYSCSNILVEACQKNDIETIKFLIQNGAKIYCLNNHFLKPIFEAYKHNNLDIVRYLLKQDTVDNYQIPYFEKLLVIACSKADEWTVQFLLEKNVNIDTQFTRKDFKRFDAFYTSDDDLYLNYPAHENLRGDFSLKAYPALLVASMHGHIKIIGIVMRYMNEKNSINKITLKKVYGTLEKYYNKLLKKKNNDEYVFDDEKKFLKQYPSITNKINNPIENNLNLYLCTNLIIKTLLFIYLILIK